MENKIREIVFIMDRSGSMQGMESDTVGGFNSVIKEHKDKDYQTLVTAVTFASDITTIIDRADVNEVKKMNVNEFRVGGCTALIDAIGSTIDHVHMIHKYIRKEDVPAKTMYVIITDGMENASRKYSLNDVKKMIENDKKEGVEFIFMGANIDAVETARHFGIDEQMAVNYHNDSIGVGKTYQAVARRSAMSFCQAEPLVDESWRKEVDEDYCKR